MIQAWRLPTSTTLCQECWDSRALNQSGFLTTEAEAVRVLPVLCPSCVTISAFCTFAFGFSGKSPAHTMCGSKTQQVTLGNHRKHRWLWVLPPKSCKSYQYSPCCTLTGPSGCCAWATGEDFLATLFSQNILCSSWSLLPGTQTAADYRFLNVFPNAVTPDKTTNSSRISSVITSTDSLTHSKVLLWACAQKQSICNMLKTGIQHWSSSPPQTHGWPQGAESCFSI